MGVYSTRELKNRTCGKSARKLDLPEGISQKIWIPKNAFLYHRVHFGIKTFTSFKSAKHDQMDCLNQTPGERGKGCPICDEIQKLWEKWRELDKKKDKTSQEEKKEVKNQINRMVAEYFITNCIHIEDTDRKFQAVTFTQAKMPDIDRVDDNYGIQNVIWLYKKSGNHKEGRKVEYTLTEMDSHPAAAELQGMVDELMGRTYEEGGPVDLEKAFIRTYTPEQYMELLTGGSEDESTPEDMDSGKSKKSEPSKKAEPKKESPKVNVEESTTSLDELDLDDKPKDPPKKAEPKKESTKTEAAGDDLSLDDLNLEPLGDLDLDADDKPKTMEVTPDSIKANMKNPAFIAHLYKHLLEQKHVSEQKDLKDQLQHSYNYVKKVGKVEIPELK